MDVNDQTCANDTIPPGCSDDHRREPRLAAPETCSQQHSQTRAGSDMTMPGASDVITRYSIISDGISDDDSISDGDFEEIGMDGCDVAGASLTDDDLPELGTVELTVGGSGEPEPRQKRRRRRVVVTRRARALRCQHHMAELMCQTVAAKLMNGICSRADVQARCLSLVPAYAIDRIAQHLVPGKHELRREWASSDLRCVLSAFQSLEFRRRPQTSSAQLLDDDFAKFLVTQRPTQPWHEPMLLVGMLRVLAFDARLSVGLTPPPLKLTVEESTEIERWWCQCDIVRDSAPGPAPASEPAAGSSRAGRGRKGGLWGDPVPRYWCEVYEQVAERWVAINAYTGAIEDPGQLAGAGRSGDGAYPYVIGMDERGGVCDTTRRYTHDYVNATRRRRLNAVSESTDPRARQWWGDWLARWEPEATDRSAHEEEMLARRTRRSKMPRRIADFAANPYYVLARNLTQGEVLHPPMSPVGTVRGEPVYLRENVRPVRTRMTWMRTGRVVRDGELPAKQVQRRDTSVDLFGAWQTDLFRPPPVVGGHVPRNEYGHVDLFVTSMLPAGAAHVPDARAKGLCDELGIDAADAVMGFEFRRGQATPIINGVVIPYVSLGLLRDALRNDREAQTARARAECETRAVGHWRRLLVALRVRREVDASFALRSARADGISFPRP
ncbi:hypothetical protein GGF46_000384 [Coemansia sp. RSA 552]|nr:hypothetical protein GGF46_000384 [Coemansia sp. RSA 552]